MRRPDEDSMETSRETVQAAAGLIFCIAFLGGCFYAAGWLVDHLPSHLLYTLALGFAVAVVALFSAAFVMVLRDDARRRRRG